MACPIGNLFTSPVDRILQKKFNILDIINLADFPYADPKRLYDRLLPLVKNKYESTDRIIILHFDVDYYIDPFVSYHPGLTVTVLQQILSLLNIPNYFVLFVTNYDNISNELIYAQKMYSADIHAIRYIPCELTRVFLDSNKIQPIDINPLSIVKKYSCFNGTARPHRRYLICLLSSNDLLSQGILSYKQTNHQETKFSFNDVDINFLNNAPVFLTTSPVELINQRYNFNQIDKLINIQDIDPIELDGKANDIDSRYQFLEIQKSFLYVATETVFQYPHPLMTEKSYKGITAKRPFVILGAQYSLKKLQDLGFKTFDKFWDEGYDSLRDPAEKLLSVYKIIESICQLPDDKLKNMLIEMTDILDHNFITYANLENTLMDKFEKDIS